MVYCTSRASAAPVVAVYAMRGEVGRGGALASIQGRMYGRRNRSSGTGALTLGIGGAHGST